MVTPVIPALEQSRASTDLATRGTRFYRWYVVIFLTLASTLSLIDRQTLALMVGPVKADLGVSDTMMGLLGGLAFTLFYTVLTMPMAWLADTGKRTRIVGWGILFWSAATILCGFAERYWHLFLARMGVGVGEAALQPAAVSLLSDMFDRARLPLAMGIFNAGPFIGIGLANLLGGLLLSHLAGQPVIALPALGAMRSWQAMFVLVGLPGLLLAILTFTIREPIRRGLAFSGKAVVTIRETIAFFTARRQVLGYMFGGYIALSIQSWGLFYWIAELFVRDHGFPRGDFGIWFGLIALTCGTSGSVAGGYLSTRLMRADELDAPMRIVFWSSLVLVPLGVLAPLSGSTTIAFAAFAAAIFMMAVPAGLVGVATQMVVPNEHRGKVVALYFIVVNFVSYALGPLLGGFISDFVFGGKSLGHTLALMAAVNYPIAALLIGLSLKPFRSALAVAAGWERDSRGDELP